MAGKKNPYATVLGMELTLEGNALAESSLPRIHRERYDLLNATLKGSEDHHFIAAVAKPDSTILSARSLRSAVQRLGEELPVVICLDRIDLGMKRGLASEGIPFISEDGNVYLPFLGIQETPTLPIPSPLSPQAQRIALNLAAGRWVDVTASELAERCGKSRASITKYLREIEAIKPALLNTSWRSRILGNDDLSREELLDLFEPYLVNPVARRHRLATLPDIHPEMLRMVRILQPTAEGIPVEIYCFSKQTDWLPFEMLQNTILDHLIASLPRFGLRIYQRPSGADFGPIRQ